jgi:hypothetical protein
MPIPARRLICTSVLAFASSTLCLADSLASSASNVGSSAVGSLSDSIQGSSNSSAGERRVAEGDYRVIEVADAAGRPDALRLRLRAVAPPAGDQRSAREDFFLELPRKALQARPLAPADVVSARHRPYGIEFARADSGEAFFLVIADDWWREFDPRAVVL